MDANHTLTDQAFWEQIQADTPFEKLPATDMFRLWINKYVPPTKEGTAMEIGCYPGRYLTILGDLGYELHGLDFFPDTKTKVPARLKQYGYKTGEFIEGDFSKHDFKQSQYDVVISLGFIEHFLNFEELIRTHKSLVKKGGYLILETPNYRGWVQRCLQLFFSPDNYSKHNIKAMNPDKWEAIIKDQFNTLYKGYFPGFYFWMDEEKRNWLQTASGKLILRFLPYLNKLFHRPSSWYSGFCGIIAQKIKD